MTSILKRARGARGPRGRDMTGRDKFRAWAQRRNEVQLDPGPRQSKLGGRQVEGMEHLREDPASTKERFERSEAFMHRTRESFPED